MLKVLNKSQLYLKTPYLWQIYDFKHLCMMYTRLSG